MTSSSKGRIEKSRICGFLLSNPRSDELARQIVERSAELSLRARFQQVFWHGLLSSISITGMLGGALQGPGGNQRALAGYSP